MKVCTLSRISDFPHLFLLLKGFFVFPGRALNISSPTAEIGMPDPAPYRSQVLDHLGLVAGRFDALGMGDVIDQATPQHPAMRDLTVGEAVQARVRHGLGCMNQALDLVPRWCQHKPTSRLMAPRMVPAQLNDDALGRALEPRDADGVPALSSLLATTAAERRGLVPRLAHLDRPSVHVEGRDNRAAEPADAVVHLIRGYRRAHRPDFNPGMVALLVAPHAGMPILRNPRSGHSREVLACGEAVRAHVPPCQTTYGMTSLVADGALDREANLQQLAQPHLPWSTRGPAPVGAAHAVLAQANPQALTRWHAGSRDHALTSSSGGMAPRGLRIDSASRPAQARRTVDPPWRQQRAKARHALKQ
jgi:hypothetical protein